MTTLTDHYQNDALEAGIDLFGVADLAPARAEIVRQGGAQIAAYPRAISMGIFLLHSLVDALPQRSERAVAIAYRKHAYDFINQRLDETASRLSSRLQREGYQALPVPASERVDDGRICASFSHKLAAHLAGLGWIGKNCMLITPQAGPRIRFATILTNAPLEARGSRMAERCGDCQECVDICPQQAFTGRAFREDELRELRFDAGKCDRYMKEMQTATGLPVCGLCLYVCPFGRKAARKISVLELNNPIP
jgi:epoxyqueuosine reductase